MGHGTTRVIPERLHDVLVASRFLPKNAGRVIAKNDFVVFARRFENVFLCTRCNRRALVCYSVVQAGQLLKVGQLPSLADLHLPDLQPYREVLGKRYAELARGVGLPTHGVGIGSFVYLRRVFEHLAEEAHEEAARVDGWDEEDYVLARMSEKILKLKTFLPTFLVKNRELYGILSKGVHELTEEECLLYFPVVQSGIEAILDSRLEQTRQKKKLAKAAAEVTRLSQTLNERSTTDETD